MNYNNYMTKYISEKDMKDSILLKNPVPNNILQT